MMYGLPKQGGRQRLFVMVVAERKRVSKKGSGVIGVSFFPFVLPPLLRGNKCKEKERRESNKFIRKLGCRINN